MGPSGADAGGLTGCAPTGCLAAPVCAPAVCRCGQPIHPVPHGDHDWAWADEQGRTIVSHVAEIYAELERCRQVTIDRTADQTDPVVCSDVMRYSVLSAAISLGHASMRHIHEPAAGTGRSSTPPPWCCGEPMHAVPTGWRCRVNRTVVEYDDLLGSINR